MPALFVLDVPEYAPLVAYAQSQAGLTISSLGGYRKIEANDEIAIPRAATGMGQAVWFGALVGGFEGAILEFSETRLAIGPDR
ncbi:MAG: hypothetical protein O7A03_08945 [Alphaproteobacteria bacterium]|nr:hypothetical protein [Alphaproteobacteria bacterium]